MKRRTVVVLLAGVLLSGAAATLLLLVLVVQMLAPVTGIGVETQWSMNISRRCADWPDQLSSAEKDLAQARVDKDRFLDLGTAAKAAFEVGERLKAERYAQELLRLAPEFPHNWNYGNAIHDGHVVLGRVALSKGDVKEACKQLLAAGKTPGSPQLDSFGPDMALARELLKKGQKRVVFEYFDECNRFWDLGHFKLKVWRFEARLGLSPDFTSNLF